MSDILQGLAGAGVPFLLAWVLPCAAAITLFVWIELPSLMPGLSDAIARLDTTERALILGLAAFALGVAMNALSTPLYRLLEGYSWPSRLRAWGKSRQQHRKQGINARIRQMPDGPEKGLLMERLQRFPVEDQELAASRLGNAMRAFERYGVDRFCLDAITFWTELVSLAPESLRTELARARSSVDFFVNGVYLASALAVGGLASIASSGVMARELILTMVSLVGAPLAYRMAVTSTSYWDSTIRALVHLGRQPLAEAYGLALPGSIEKEREMWTLVAAFAFYPYNSEWADQLDSFRAVARDRRELQDAALPENHPATDSPSGADDRDGADTTDDSSRPGGES